MTDTASPGSRSVALVRGVGGPTAMRMPALREALAAAGLTDVATLQVAGNIVVDPAGRSDEELADLVRSTIRASFGHDLPVLVRSHEELRDLVARNPYLGTQEGRWVLTMVLDRVPDDDDVDAALETCAQIAPQDAFLVDGRAVFLRYAAGVGISKLQGAWLERRLRVVGTARNATTIEKLIALTA